MVHFPRKAKIFMADSPPTFPSLNRGLRVSEPQCHLQETFTKNRALGNQPKRRSCLVEPTADIQVEMRNVPEMNLEMKTSEEIKLIYS